MSGWALFLFGYCLLALITFLPVARAMARAINLQEAIFSFEHCPHFSEENRVRLTQHYDRLRGALLFWKNEAAKYGRLHYYCVAWTIFGGITIPFLAQAINTNDPFSKWSLTVISAHIAILYVSQKAFKVEQNYKNFRLGESEYYDLRRRLLDMPSRLGTTEQIQIENYFEIVETLRVDMRRREVDGIASFADVKQALSEAREERSDGRA